MDQKFINVENENNRYFVAKFLKQRGERTEI